MKNIDIKMLAKILGFDLIPATTQDNNISTMILINENLEKIDNFNSNKIIYYNINISDEEFNNSIEHQLSTYLMYRTENKLVLDEFDYISNKKKRKLSIEEISKIINLPHSRKNKIKALTK